jgi:large subunit ribosomal protein L17
LFSNLVAALFTHGRIRTTEAKAKATRRIAERTITWARRLGDVLTKTPDNRTDEEKARVVHAVRMARRVVRDRQAVLKLFEEVGPRYLARRGGYTRIVKLGQRPGDAAPMTMLELIPDEAPVAKSAGAGEAEGKTAAKSAKSKSTGAKASAKAAGEGTAEAGEKKPRSRAKKSTEAKSE